MKINVEKINVEISDIVAMAADQGLEETMFDNAAECLDSDEVADRLWGYASEREEIEIVMNFFNRLNIDQKKIFFDTADPTVVTREKNALVEINAAMNRIDDIRSIMVAIKVELSKAIDNIS